jgi:hypothetical protein
MTLQLGLLGTDGLVIASDQNACFADDPIRSSSTSPKIFWDTHRGIVCAASGDLVAPLVAKDLVKLEISAASPRDEVFDILQRSVEELWRTHVPKKYNGDPDRNPSISLLVGLTANPHHLWRIGHPKVASGAAGYLDKIHNGDGANSAKYFTERFYKHPQLLPINDLVFLAAHTIIEGGRLNPTMVGGLELLTWKFGEREPKLFSDQDKRELTDRSDRLIEALRTSIFSLPQPRT